MDPDLSDDPRHARNVQRFLWFMTVLFLLLMASTPWAILFFRDNATRIIARQVPVVVEEQIGASAFAKYRAEHRLLETEAGQRALGALVQPLVEAVPEPRYTLRIHVADAKEVNAFALPGGTIVLHAGLVLQAERADEVLGVLAHEIAHVTEQHGIRNLLATLGTIALIRGLFGDVEGVLGLVVQAAPFLLSQAYSRGYEAEADREALVLLEAAQINPRGLLRFFERLQALHSARWGNGEPGALVQQTLGYLSSHPATEDRIAALEAAIGDLPDGGISLDDALRALQAELREFAPEAVPQNP